MAHKYWATAVNYVASQSFAKSNYGFARVYQSVALHQTTSVGLLSVDGIDSEFYMTMLCNALDVTNCTSYWNISICTILTSDVITACSNTHQIQSTSHLNWRVAMWKFIFQYPFFLSNIPIIYSMYYSTNLNVGHSWWVDTGFDTTSYKHFTRSTAALLCITEKDRCVQYQLVHLLHHLRSTLHHIQSVGHFEE